MLFDPGKIKIMREALFTAEQALRYQYPLGLEEDMREWLAKEILDIIGDGATNPLVIASIALRKLNARAVA